jgi:hypothetical protein
MRCFLPPVDTRFYAGVDLHARSLFLCILDRDGQERFSRNLPAAPPPFLKAVQPFRDGLASIRLASVTRGILQSKVTCCDSACRSSL